MVSCALRKQTRLLLLCCCAAVPWLLLQEVDILFFYSQVHKLQPGFFIAVDCMQHKLLWVIRGAWSNEMHLQLYHSCSTPLQEL